MHGVVLLMACRKEISGTYAYMLRSFKMKVGCA